MFFVVELVGCYQGTDLTAGERSAVTREVIDVYSGMQSFSLSSVTPCKDICSQSRGLQLFFVGVFIHLPELPCCSFPQLSREIWAMRLRVTFKPSTGPASGSPLWILRKV